MSGQLQIQLMLIPLGTPKVLVDDKRVPIKGKTIFVRTEAKGSAYSIVKLDPSKHSYDRLYEGCERGLIYILDRTRVTVSKEAIEEHGAAQVV